MARAERTIMELMVELREQSEALRRDPAHQIPRCVECHNFVHPGRRRDTGIGIYEDNETRCAFCVANRNEQLGAELREENSNGTNAS